MFSTVDTMLFASLCLFLVLPSSEGFLFPDLKLVSVRSGNAAKQRIAVIQEEPYLFANGSGYLPDLMKLIDQSHRLLHDGEEFPYDILPVKTWAELINRAKHSRSQVAFGLIVPALELTKFNWKNLESSAPTLYTTFKIVRKAGKVSPDYDVNTGSEFSESRVHLQEGMQVIVVKDSPAEYLLVRANSYRGPVHVAENLETAVDFLRSSDDSVLLVDAGVADYIKLKATRDLQFSCPKKIPGSFPIFYSFFGSDSTTLDRLNKSIAHLASTDGLLNLYTRYFGTTRQCPW